MANMTDEARPQQRHDHGGAVYDEQHHEPAEGEELADDPHASSMPDIVLAEGGIPAVMWSAHRLGDHESYAICANVVRPSEITFWLCSRTSDPHKDKIAEWRVVGRLARVERGGGDSVYAAPECWLTAGKLRLMTLIYPIDEWAAYTIEGLP